MEFPFLANTMKFSMEDLKTTWIYCLSNHILSDFRGEVINHLKQDYQLDDDLKNRLDSAAWTLMTLIGILKPRSNCFDKFEHNGEKICQYMEYLVMSLLKAVPKDQWPILLSSASAFKANHISEKLRELSESCQEEEDQHAHPRTI